MTKKENKSVETKTRTEEQVLADIGRVGIQMENLQASFQQLQQQRQGLYEELKGLVGSEKASG